MASLFSGFLENLLPILRLLLFIFCRYAGIAWMKASFLGCTPGFGGTSVLPAAFSRKASSTIPTISFIGTFSLSTSDRERYSNSPNGSIVNTQPKLQLEQKNLSKSQLGQPPPTGGIMARTSPSESFVFNPSNDAMLLPLTRNCRNPRTSPVLGS